MQANDQDNLMEESLDPSSSPTESNDSDSSEQQTTNETQGGSATEFTHPLLRGKSAQEIERLLELSSQTIRDQQDALRKAQSQPEAPAPVQTETEEDDEFDWGNPGKSFKKRDERLIQKVQHLLDNAIQPFREDLSVSRRQGVRQAMREKFNDFDQMEPYIDNFIAKGNFPDPDNEALLTTLYYTARGYASTNQGEVPVSTPPKPNRPGQPTPPQHRPSSAPMPPNPSAKKVELTEDEKLMARNWGMSAEEFVKYRDADADAVLNLGDS